jgi:hypothetical protein
MKKNGYFYHVPRTGGFSTYKWFEKLSRKEWTRLWNDGHTPFKSKKQLIAKFGSRAMKADGIELKVEDLITITWLRDPVNHSISLYTYIKTHGGEKKFRGFKDGASFSEWIRRPGSPGNYVKFFAPGDGKLETAIRNLETVDFIGFTETFNSDMDRLMRFLELDIKYNKKKINSSSGSFKPSKKDIKHLKERRVEDYILVNEFRKRLGLPLFV